MIESDGGGAALVAGHAFGNRVARMLATDRPELVRGVSLIAANVGHAPSTPPIREAIRNSANNALPDEERLKALRFAFFAPGNDPRPWLKGWHPEVLAAQRIAGDQTSRQVDYAGGNAPILYLQPGHDPLAHVEDAHEFKRALGDRVTVIVIDNASHAAIEEQPEAISRALIDFAKPALAVVLSISQMKTWRRHPPPAPRFNTQYASTLRTRRRPQPEAIARPPSSRSD